MSETAVAVTYSVEPSKMQLVACWPSVISSSTSPSGESTVRPPEIVVHTNSRPSAANGMRHRLRPVHPALPVERDAVRIDVRPLGEHLAAAVPVEHEQLAGRGRRGPRILLRAGVREPEPAVGTEGQVVGPRQRVAGDLRGEQLDAAVRVHAL